ncbi:hypothetical protein BCR34DRAFT_652514 [Clohesyomyces aquaticus]|uniref:Uncharacterized protein n=1 Tax=Clohesyomyces aquaticus TaxID=1231657 RepID=A0A1Y2A7Q5_9PLEO|nr:hypothetical protein BCR34DRAFT_652514 [Clohesyomyces aquaticus]
MMSAELQEFGQLSYPSSSTSFTPQGPRKATPCSLSQSFLVGMWDGGFINFGFGFSQLGNASSSPPRTERADGAAWLTAISLGLPPGSERSSDKFSHALEMRPRTQLSEMNPLGRMDGVGTVHHAQTPRESIPRTDENREATLFSTRFASNLIRSSEGAHLRHMTVNHVRPRSQEGCFEVITCFLPSIREPMLTMTSPTFPGELSPTHIGSMQQ